MPPVITQPTWLTVNDIPLATPAWLATDLSSLLNDGPVRGRDRVMPGVNGVRPFLRRRTARVATIPMTIFGEFDDDGTANENPVQGAIDHMLYLSDNLGIALGVGDGTVLAEWTLPDLSVISAGVHVLGLFGTTDVGRGVLRTTLDLSIPDGRFTEDGS